MKRRPGTAARGRARPVPRRDRLVRRWPWILGLTAFGLLVIADRCGLLLAGSPGDLGAYDGLEVLVSDVFDAATIEVQVRDVRTNSPVTRLRLWGIQCVSAGPPDGAGAIEIAGAQATEFTRSVALGRRVRLKVEPQRTRDPEGSVLAHIDLPDGSRLNEELLAAGLVWIDGRWPHQMAGRYAQLETAARRQGAGIWAAGP